jgi:ABC-type Fe3+/spermidine/putrescine transport system ATPase subunit
MSDRVAVMADGEVVQIGTPTEVYERPRSRFVAEFLGTANILSGTVSGAAGAGAWTIDLDIEAGRKGIVAAAGAPPVGRRVQVAIRPERLSLAAAGGGTLEARIRDIVFRGSYFAYELSVGAAADPLFAYRQDRLAVSQDGTVGVSWAPESAVLLEGVS